MYGRASSSRQLALTGTTEFDILKASHKFLREDGEADRANGATSTSANASWGDRLAQKYYASLYREFAVCDLKHYKSGNFALRWRTEDEVISGAGEETCGNTRCPLHSQIPTPAETETEEVPKLKTVELPFGYEEHGEYKSALVKVVLCETCLRKLMWKREREKKGRTQDTEKESPDKGSGVNGEKGEKNMKDVKDVKGGKERSEDEQDRRPNGKQKEQYELEERRKRRKSRSTSRSPSSHRRKRKHRDKSNHR